MKTAELRELSKEALVAELAKGQQELAEARLAGGDEMHSKRKLRRQIARVKTLLREKELE